MLLSPGEEARVGTRQMLSMMVAKYLLIGVRGQAVQLAGLARLAASSLLAGLIVWWWLLQSWRRWCRRVRW